MSLRLPSSTAPPFGLDSWVPLVDPLYLVSGLERDCFARNAEGLHVPASTFSAEDQRRAWSAAKAQAEARHG